MNKKDVLIDVSKRVEAFKKGETTEFRIPPLKMSAKKTEKAGLFMLGFPPDVPVTQIQPIRYPLVNYEEMKQERRYFPDHTDKMLCRLMKAVHEVQRLVYYAEEHERIKKDSQK